MENRDPGSSSPVLSITVIRIIWAALLMGPVVFLVMIVAGVLPTPKGNAPQPILSWINLAMLLTVVPATFVIRMIVFRRATVDNRVALPAYSTGNIIFWAGCEGVSFSGLVFAMLNGSLSPTIYAVAVAMVLQVMTFPITNER